MKVLSAKGLRLLAAAFFCVMVIVAVRLGYAGEIVLPSTALEREGPVRMAYRTGSLVTGKGELSVKWTDVYGRVVENRKIPFVLTDESEVGFTLDLRRAVAMRNELTVHFSLEGVNKKGERDHREEDAQTSFVARPPDRKWWDYSIIMWQDHTAEHYALLKSLGINAAMYSGKAKTPPEDLLKTDLRWYAENVATDFYAEYHRWFPDRPVHWKFQEAKELYRKDPASKEAFKRHPSLVDPEWLRRIHDRLAESARINSPYRPLFYNLGDESGIADLAAYWDFDFSDQSLVEMRRWLEERYGTLDALNQEWGTGFGRWELVTPMTTNEAMKRTDDNFSAWADFKEWMDISFARAVRMGVDAVRSVDPDAYVALEGTQLPGWGGYDYALLAKILTAIEPYDYACNVEIIRSLNPEMAVVTTSGGGGPWEKLRVWYELLHASRGLILWDAKSEYVQKDGSIGRRGREAEPYYNEIRSGIGALVINSRRVADPIAIHHSQASLRIAWMLQHKPEGEAWVNRTSSSDEKDSSFRWVRESYCRLIEDLGWQYNFVDSAMIEQGELLSRGYRVLILPDSSALSAAEAKAMREFVEQGGVLIGNGHPGAFDEHGRRLPQPQLADLFDAQSAAPFTVRHLGQGKAIHLNVEVLNYYRDRLLGKEKDLYQLMGSLLRENLENPPYAVTDPSGAPVVGIETQVFRNGGVTIVSLLTNPQLSVSDLGPPEAISNRRFESPRTVVLTLPDEFFVYDVRATKARGKMKKISVNLNPYEPSVFAISPEAIPRLRLLAPDRIGRGETGQIGVSFSGISPAATHVFHLDVVDPSGKIVPQYSGNILAPNGHSAKLLPLALNDSPGKWEVRVKDLMSGQTRVSTLELY
ncbi:MAG: hypothetical protein DMG23_08820 [Acidobacteria bacterium]|nr:MAG: hypothetical protein DMG23_08820 [Acidobacteriota bacterium]